MDRFIMSSRLQKISIAVMKIFEIVYWIKVFLLVCMAGAVLFKPGFMEYFSALLAVQENGPARLSGFGLEITSPSGLMPQGITVIFCIAGVMIFSLYAMVFRNLYLIFTRNAKGSVFDDDNIRMMGEIGIFAVSAPAIGLFCAGAIALYNLSAGTQIETVVSFNGLVMGLVVFSLTSFFIRGQRLEKETEGLI